jgi:lactoylglutathione lyase
MNASEMKFRMVHENYNVLDLDRSLRFYKEALGLTEKRRNTAPDGSYIIVFAGNDQNDYELELTWLKDHKEPYDLGEQEFHLAFKVEDFTAAHELHKKMGCICFENPAIGIYFIEDPDGYWLEIIPEKR